MHTSGLFSNILKQSGPLGGRWKACCKFCKKKRLPRKEQLTRSGSTEDLCEMSPQQPNGAPQHTASPRKEKRSKALPVLENIPGHGASLSFAQRSRDAGWDAVLAISLEECFWEFCYASAEADPQQPTRAP